MSVEFDCTSRPRTNQGINQDRPPFAMVPHDIAADPRLSAIDLRVLAALLYYARQDPSCRPSDASLGERVHKHPSTIRRSLHRLEELGYIRRSFFPASPANPTGRTIYLNFTSPDWPRPASGCCTQAQPPALLRTTPAQHCPGGPRTPARGPRAPVHANEDFTKKEDRNVNVTDSSTTRPDVQPPILPVAQSSILPITPVDQHYPEAICPDDQDPVHLDVQSPARPVVQPPTSSVYQDPVRPLLEELQTVGPTTTPERVRRLASRLSQALQDVASLAFYIATISRVVAGVLPLPCLLAAYKAGVAAVGKARKPGALFCWYLRNWTPPPKPSEIRYYQTRTVARDLQHSRHPTPLPRRLHPRVGMS